MCALILEKVALVTQIKKKKIKQERRRRRKNRIQKLHSLELFVKMYTYPSTNCFHIQALSTLIDFLNSFEPLFLEPIGFKAPMLSSDVRGVMITKRKASGFALLCPAQGYPIPNFR